MNNNKFLDLTGLAKYDGLIKAYIAAGDGALRAELDAAIAALNAKIGELDGSDDKTLAETIEDIYASLAGIIETQDSLVAKDAEIEGKIAEEIGKIVGTLTEGETAMTLVEVAASLKSLGDRVTANEGEIAGVKERVTAVEEAVSKLGDLGDGTNLGTLVQDITANTAAIEKLNGEADVEGSVKKAAADAQAAAIEAAGAAAAELYQVKGDYEAAGAAADAQAAAIEAAAADATSKAAAAESAAKTYADTLVKDAEGKSLFDAAGTAADLNDEMDKRVKVLEEIDHEKLAADASATAVAAIVADAGSDFDTLKEVADWIASDKEGSAALQTTVSGHTESINTINGELDALELKVDGDIANLTTHMTEAAAKIEEVDGRLAALDAFVEAHDRIPDSDINSLFGITTEE